MKWIREKGEEVCRDSDENRTTADDDEGEMIQS
jgi:hypothetical protein